MTHPRCCSKIQFESESQRFNYQCAGRLSRSKIQFESAQTFPIIIAVLSLLAIAVLRYNLKANHNCPCGAY